MEPLFRVKLNVTIYRDFDDWYWDTYNPKYDYPSARLGTDYEMLRKGTILSVYKYSDMCEAEVDPNEIICESNIGAQIFYNSLEDLLQDEWFEIIKEKKDAKR